ncbi:MAG: hypothetical protein F4X56_01755 [Gammaproteobacteria bacterium]|nr:hypothetical protein [Gammaproteobacteria bacterium]
MRTVNFGHTPRRQSLMDSSEILPQTDVSDGVFKAGQTRPQIAPLLRNILVLVLVLTSTGCSEIDRVCQSGLIGRNFGLLPLFFETFAAVGVVAFIISVAFYLLFQAPKLRKWDLSESQVAPKVSASYLFPITLIVLLVVFAGLFYGADCAEQHKLVHILGVISGIAVGFGGGLLICRKFITKPFKKIPSEKNQDQ